MHHAIYIVTNVLFLLFWAVGLVRCTRFAVRRAQALRAAVARRRRPLEGA
jgi:hypothetical protein